MINKPKNNQINKPHKKTGPKGPNKLNKDTIGKLEYVFSMDGTIQEACLYADIHPDTYYEWIKRDKKLSERFAALRNKPVLTARKEVIKGLKHNPEFSMKYLERKKANEFALKQRFEHSGDPSNPILIICQGIDLKKLPKKSSGCKQGKISNGNEL